MQRENFAPAMNPDYLEYGLPDGGNGGDHGGDHGREHGGDYGGNHDYWQDYANDATAPTQDNTNPV